MFITKEQLEAMLRMYIKEKHNADECIGFIDGMNAILELLLKATKLNIDLSDK
jgi:hypothetical protein